MTADGQGMGLKRHAIAVPPEALEAWTYYDPPQFKHESGRIRDAFLSGWLARTIPAQPSSADEGVVELRQRIAELEALLNTPEVDDFAKGAVLEAAHQRVRWGADHDAGKSPFDWFWLVGYLAQKAATAAVAGDSEKAKHHTISTAAALANWHLALSGTDTRMVPGAPLPIIKEADAA